jgi:hypothetical protein
MKQPTPRRCHPLGAHRGLARARGDRRRIDRACPSCLILENDDLEAQPDAKQGVVGTKIQRELLPVIVRREVFVLAE